MKTKFNHRLFLLLAVAVLFVMTGCSPSDPDPVNVEQTAVGVGRVVAVGNSLTAGFMSGGLEIRGQRAGYANLVARQITGVDMSMPLVAVPGIGSASGFTPLYVSATGDLVRDPLPVSDPALLLLAALQPTPYDNLGVPGALTVDLLTRTGAIAPPGSPLPPNPFFDIVLRNTALPPGDATQLDQLEALATQGEPLPSTLLLWIGNNDVLGGSTGGNPAVGVNITPPLISQAGDLSFEAQIGAIVARVAAMGVPEVAIANVPSVDAAPYFTTVPLNEPTSGLPWATDEADVAAILLTAQAILGPEYIAGVGTESLGSEYTLTNTELATVRGVIEAYNLLIADVAAANDWALVDIDAALSTLPNDTSQPATFAVLNSAFPLLPGLGQNQMSAFSLDGIHPSERGYARVANEFLMALNATYGTSYPMVDEDAVSNEIGFERFGTGRNVGFAESGVAGLAATAKLGTRN